MNNRLKIIPTRYFEEYKRVQPITLRKHFDKVKNQVINYGYAISLSAVSSSQIEGNVLDFDTYWQFDTGGYNTQTKSFREIKFLEQAYKYAQVHALNEKNFLHTHELMADPDVFENKYRGKYRDVEVFVGSGQMVVYRSPKAELVPEEMQKLFADIAVLRKRDLTLSQVFYFASLIHLVFVNIHPFADGNGRCARLLEKWFLADKLGTKAWGICSEKLYLKRRKSYYNNLARLGSEYDTLDYDKCFPFLKMLPMALRIK